MLLCLNGIIWKLILTLHQWKKDCSILQPVWIKLDYRWVTGQISKRPPARHVGPRASQDGFRFHWRVKGHCASCLLLLLRRLRTGSSPHWLCGTENSSVPGMRSLLQDGFALLVLRLLCIPMCRTHDMLQSTGSILLLCDGIRSATRWWSALHGQHVLPELLPQNRMLHEAWWHEAQGDAVGLGIYHWLDFPPPIWISACNLIAFEARHVLETANHKGFRYWHSCACIRDYYQLCLVRFARGESYAKVDAAMGGRWGLMP